MMRIGFCLLYFGLVQFLWVDAVPNESEESSDEVQNKPEKGIQKFLPSKAALEEVGIQFLDVLIKAGQIEMAKGAFRTQLDVLKKVHPDQYSKYKKIPIDQLAADAVFEQAEAAKVQQKTGNRLVDMLHENGIPIGSSIRGLQQALRTQREMEKSDPTEQIAKAVFEKFQKQILPGLVANLIAGRNPLQLPQRPDVQKLVSEGDPARFLRAQHEQALQQLNNKDLASIGKVQDKQYDIRPMIGQAGVPEIRRKPLSENKEEQSGETEEEEADDETSEYTNSDEENVSPEQENRIKHIKRYKRSTTSGEPTQEGDSNRPLAPRHRTRRPRRHVEGIDHSDEEDEPARRRAPSTIPTDLASKIRASPRLKVLFDNEELAYKLSDPEHLLEPKSVIQDPKPQPGFVPLRPIPKRPRKMLPLLIGIDEDQSTSEEADNEEEDKNENDVNNPFSGEEIHDDDKDNIPRRHPGKIFETKNTVSDAPLTHHHSRVLENLRNNPALAPIFEDEELMEKMSRPSVLSDGQRMSGYGSRKSLIYPRAYAAKIKNQEPSNMDSKVKQVIEERPIPPLFSTPKGKHTRLRWTGATERELPGLGGRFVVPSLDPTMPAINSVVATQGKQRDEYDSTFKIPNYWEAGDTLGVQMKTKSERLIGGNGAVDFPAMGHDDLHFG
uniref:Uncharacterized protein n=1 Tax=Acrobeloides nanus TaxID=290746 RepID=A0A914EQE8_9BILA